MKISIILMLVLALVACKPADREPTGDSVITAEEIVETLSDTATDEKQKELWQQVDARDASAMAALVPSDDVVKTRKPSEAPDVAVERTGYPPLPETLTTAVYLLEVPDFEESFEGMARPVAVKGDVLEFDLGQERILVVQAKAGGRVPSLERDTEVKLHLRVGDPMQRNDILEISSESFALAWALIGGTEPVVVTLDSLDLEARQVGKPEGGIMAVEISVGDASRMLTEFAEPVLLEEAGVVVHVLGSVGAVGDAAGVVPESYRLEVAAWPARTEE